MTEADLNAVREWLDSVAHLKESGLGDCDDERVASAVRALLDEREELRREFKNVRNHPNCNYQAAIFCNKCGWLGPKGEHALNRQAPPGETL